MTRKHWLWIMLAVAFVIGFIFFNSLLSDAQSSSISVLVSQFFRPVLNPFQVIAPGSYRKLIRKLAHFVEFAVLGGCLGFGAQKLKFKGKWVIAVVLALVIACSDEIIQSFSADRTNSVFDVCIDLAGAVCGMIAVSLLKKYNKQRGMHHG